MVSIDIREETSQGLLLSFGEKMGDNIGIGGLF